MKSQRLLTVLTILNVALLLILVAQQVVSAAAQSITPVLRGRALEIIDEQGRVRASLNVLPASHSAVGASSAETVLLRLITEKGRPSIKVGASETTSGMSIAGPTGTKETYVILEARDTGTSLIMRNEGGPEQKVKAQ